MSGFSIAWLDLREAADHAARDPELLRQSLTWLAQSKTRTAVDLGCGTGSTLRAFGEEARSLQWRLVDRDPKLLDEAARRHAATHPLETHVADLTELDRLPLRGAALVTASALFDLASREFCLALVERLRAESSGLYAALNYDGITEWSPRHPLDGLVLQSFNRDQLRDKGFGPALGPGATDYLAGILEEAGFRVFIRPSPWRLATGDALLVEELVRGIAAAVSCDPTLGERDLQQWLSFRLANAAIGTCTVGHLDLLALPR